MRSRYQAGRHEARVSGLHSHTREYTVRFYVDGIHQPGADYFTSDKDDAHGTARAEIARLRLVQLVTPKTHEHEKHAAHHNQCRAALSGGSWRKTVYERALMAETPAIASWWPAIY